MPRKTKATQAKPETLQHGPTQGQIARLIQDSFDLFSNELLVKMSGESHFSKDDLTNLQSKILSTKQDIQNRALDQLIKHY
jgi:hypothetical protein